MAMRIFEEREPDEDGPSEQEMEARRRLHEGRIRRNLAGSLHRLRTAFDGVRAQLERGCLTGMDRSAIIGQLHYGEARRAMVEFAVMRRVKRGDSIDDRATISLVARVIDAWLDDNCHHCDGRGFNGGSHRGERQVICKPCHGSGSRRGWIGRSDGEREFAQHLLSEIERLMAGVGAEMRRRLKD
jgi:hypothetical protein